jgi:hypothetical protein
MWLKIKTIISERGVNSSKYFLCLVTIDYFIKMWIFWEPVFLLQHSTITISHTSLISKPIWIFWHDAMVNIWQRELEETGDSHSNPVRKRMCTYKNKIKKAYLPVCSDYTKEQRKLAVNGYCCS